MTRGGRGDQGSMSETLGRRPHRNSGRKGNWGGENSEAGSDREASAGCEKKEGKKLLQIVMTEKAGNHGVGRRQLCRSRQTNGREGFPGSDRGARATVSKRLEQKQSRLGKGARSPSAKTEEENISIGRSNIDLKRIARWRKDRRNSSKSNVKEGKGGVNCSFKGFSTAKKVIPIKQYRSKASLPAERENTK